MNPDLTQSSAAVVMASPSPGSSLDLCRATTRRYGGSMW
jgi:hypothetical protein